MSIDGIGDLHGPKRVAPAQGTRGVKQTTGTGEIGADSYDFSDSSRVQLLADKIKVLAANAPDVQDRAALINELKGKINDPMYNEGVLRELASRIAESIKQEG